MNSKLYLILGGFILALALVAGVLFYGNHKDGEGYDRREREVKEEIAKRNIEVFQERQRMQAARDDAELLYVNLKNTTDVQLAAADSVSDRLRQRTSKAIRERDAAIASGRAYADGTDWIGAFSACHSEYGVLGKDAARIADKFRGLQLYEQSQGTVKLVPAPAK